MSGKLILPTSLIIKKKKKKKANNKNGTKIPVSKHKDD